MARVVGRWTVNKALGYERLRRRGRAFRRLIGVTPAAFEEIVERVRPRWLGRERRKKKSGRPHGMGGLEEQLIGLLVYYRFYTTHLFIGSLFGVDDSTVCRRFAVLEPLVAGAVAINKDRTCRRDDLETLLIDATEQPIERPRRRQRRFYSGKNKRHTLKTEIQVTERGRIVAVSKPFPGAVHDIEVRRRGPPLPASSRAYVDSGYQGLHKHHAETELPYKRRRGRPLSQDEKDYNHALSRIRVKVENVIRRLKVFRILAERYRNKRRGYGIKVNIIAGIVNLLMGY